MHVSSALPLMLLDVRSAPLLPQCDCVCVCVCLVMCDISFVNQAHIINQNPRVTAINSCIEVDLTGQVCADSIGTRMYSGMSVCLSHMYSGRPMSQVDSKAHKAGMTLLSAN